ncbi:hypothetical protein GTP44_11400 [Duganella sp. FT50W]|uniref:Uncharacterized protein n=1 Tax=Duganella lactea TaxID=2692173 RepID=A0A6L8MHM3_9BURK|nr:hypothetical protein [Duganella lactea]MYM82557.1 hypothetical protein [Duganella lactea]
MVTAISLSEFKKSAPEIYRRLIESDGPIYIETDGRAVIQIRRFHHGPEISHIREDLRLNDEDIVFPIEPDGYEPFK